MLFYVDRIVIEWFGGIYDTLRVHKILKHVDPFMTVVGNGSTLIAVGLIIYVAGRYYNKKLHLMGRSLFIGLLTTGAIIQVIKHSIGRARPKLSYDPLFIGPSLKTGYDSFPSGHSAMVFFFAYTLSQYYPKYRVLFYLFALAVSIDRVEELAHFPSDILAGAIIGLLMGKIFAERIPALKAEVPQ